MTRKLLKDYSNVMLGVEVEVEFNPSMKDSIRESLSLDVRPMWNLIRDGSLRNGGEFIFVSPFTAPESHIALKALDHILTDTDKYLNDLYSSGGVYLTDRTSVHVHIDFRGYSSDEIIAFVTKYLAFEELLFLLVDPLRSKNNFCKKLGDSSLLLNYTNISPASVLISSIEKYSALNTRTLAKFGSIEFRHHHGSYKYEELSNWIITLIELRRYILSVDYNTLINDLRSRPYEIVNDIIGSAYPYLSTSDIKDSINKGINTITRVLEKDRLSSVKIQPGSLFNFRANFKG
jgi:hypothetical protein